MTLIRFCVCTYSPCCIRISRRRGSTMFLFISGEAFGDACFLMSGNKSSRLFLYIKSNADFGDL